MKNEKVILAYSGGLDTSVILKWLKNEYNFDVIAVCVDVGQEEDLTLVKNKALSTGAHKAYIVDVKEEFVTDYIFPTLKAGAIYEDDYLLGTSFARPLIAKKLVEIAEKEEAIAIAHGATGKGNDQVRFEATIKALNPHLKIIAPWREWNLKSREDCIDYALKHNIPVPVTKKDIYSRDRNIWHLSHEGGNLENPWNEHDENIYQICVKPQDAPDKPTYIEIEFEKGVPISIDGKKYSPVDLIYKLNDIGGVNGIGIIDIIENRLVGMKSRGVYETPGGTILYEAHKALEKLVLDRPTLSFKKIVAEKYAQLVYDGLWFTPLKEALDKFIDSTQQVVTGTVKLKLYKGTCKAMGTKSPYSLYNEDFVTFGEDNVYNQKDAEGFINLFTLSIKIRSLMNYKKENFKKEKQII
ncbi:argininosuccinate synthase [Caminicella sporogenes DSM 14501]|uniref:Argininosuccinate synthase n=1 Tax=Caminicella sporogenes DSM 14501 TaxID=1121266 RepID=A0A1M6S8Z7_9FIRM|nr:argininosuccinate synthase [Caminicella sporogenes]RKD26911.1 argininosuccinate synthase [Caminicella sporogenes]SHK40997.1 argininosuccinate synthase [Caminicella sporogenes DSM 14501]